MRGLGRSSAAISVVNALATGIGCAVGVRLYAAASLDLEPAATPGLVVEPAESGTPLVRASVERALGAAAPGKAFSARLHLDSEIPVAKGLKSSSAVSTAVIRAVDRALGTESTDLDVAALAARVGREVGVSATGALDDALASLVPGFVVTNNREDRLLLRAPVDPEWTAVVHVPPGTHPPSAAVRERFHPWGREGSAAAEAALRGEWADAMHRNTSLVERVMGYKYAGLRHLLAGAGAVASGVSGMGPALVALAPRHRAAGVLAAMPPERFTVPLCTEARP
ncbi:MAG TPA: shikimate kinase [Thermoplasmata archaeon]|nr:shikimate kinase [Thermoplasmata archaeon]